MRITTNSAVPGAQRRLRPSRPIPIRDIGRGNGRGIELLPDADTPGTPVPRSRGDRDRGSRGAPTPSLNATRSLPPDSPDWVLGGRTFEGHASGHALKGRVSDADGPRPISGPERGVGETQLGFETAVEVFRGCTICGFHRSFGVALPVGVPVDVPVADLAGPPFALVQSDTLAAEAPPQGQRITRLPVSVQVSLLPLRPEPRPVIVPTGSGLNGHDGGYAGRYDMSSDGKPAGIAVVPRGTAPTVAVISVVPRGAARSVTARSGAARAAASRPAAVRLAALRALRPIRLHDDAAATVLVFPGAPGGQPPFMRRTARSLSASNLSTSSLATAAENRTASASRVRGVKLLLERAPRTRGIARDQTAILAFGPEIEPAQRYITLIH
jgi:hypothetical protein